MTSPRRLAVALAAAVASAAMAVVTGPAGAAAPPTPPAAGTLSRFAGGLGEGVAANVAQQPVAIATRDGRLVSVEGGFPLPAMGGDTARPGLVRTMDLASGTQTVLAGILVGGYRGDGGPATTAQLNFPADAAIDAAGNVYITDTGNNRVRKVTPAGIITTFAGNGTAGFTGDGGAATSASLRQPGAIAVSPAGDVVFADRGNARIRKVSPAGTITTIAGTGSPTGPSVDGGPALAAALDAVKLAFDTPGNLFATEHNKPAARKILVDGTITTVTGPADAPWFAGVDGAGNLYWQGSRFFRTDPSGTTTHIAGNGRTQYWYDPNGDGGPATEAFVHGGLAFDGGNIYIVAAGDHRIRRIDADGIITTVAGNGSEDVSGDGGQARGARLNPMSVIRSGPTGTYIGNPTVPEIRRVDPAGVVSTIHPGEFSGMTVDDDGNVYLSRGYQVLRLTPDGVLSTVAGTGVSGFSGDGGPATLARLAGPGTLAVDHAGSLYVYDHGNRRIRRIDPAGIITTVVGGAENFFTGNLSSAGETYLSHVGDMAVDAEGSLYWTDHDAQWTDLTLIRKAECGIVRDLGGYPGYAPGSLAVDAAGSVFFTVADEVRRLTADGTLTTIAGTGGSVPLDGLAATSVRLPAPTAGVVVHPSGRLLFGSADRVWQVEGVTAGYAVGATPCPTPDRAVWGTGYNALGQLGDGTTADRTIVAAYDPPLTSVTAMAGGVGHSLALRADGTVWAWGWNGYGQLGDGTVASRLRPAPVPGLTGVVAVAGGAFHSLALKSDGTVWAWGWNPFGELGDGTLVSRTSPTRVVGLTGVVAISAGTLHSLAVRSDGSVWAWGWNGVGQLGDGTVVDRRLPTRVPGVTGATGVAAGGLHSLAVTSSGTVWAWGWNTFGQLGDGTTNERHTPAHVYGITDATSVAAGSYHSLALRRDGTVAAWGFGNVGQLGQGSTNSSLTPVTAAGLTGVDAIAAGAFHSLALLGDGRVMAWGWNVFGQLATAGQADWDHPIEAVDLDHASAIGTGAYHSLFAFHLPA